ncbi:outer membrane beta-barrel protein [Chitinimonas lacunae]|uniref:Outer membrane beta-barrel protein n=1 Tax=Chitinimonas lacunae TaxID=1963018 RepID=A0ABV8MST2_9NEIS
MSKTLKTLFATLALTLSGAAMAAPTGQHSGLRFVMTGGLTGGGDKLSTVRYTNGSSKSIRTGALVQFGAGVVWRDHELPASIKLTANMHMDIAPGSNGDVYFRRFPIELIGYYHPTDRWMVGVGARWAVKPKLVYDIDGYSNRVRFDNAYGLLFEVGYNFNDHLALIGRYAHEDYEYRDFNSNDSIDGSHLGLMLDYRF